MFIAITFLTLALIGYLSLRNWTRESLMRARLAKKTLEHASHLLALKQWEEAKTVLLPYLHHPHHAQHAHVRYAEALRGLRRFDEALNCMRYALMRYPDDLHLRLEEGKLLLELDQPEQALEAFQACVSILHQDSDTLALADALLKVGQAEACWELIGAQAQTSSQPPLLTLAAETLVHMGRFADAIELYLKATQLGERSHRVFNQLGHAYRRLGNLQAAESLFRSLLEKDPADVEATLGLGACMEERGLHLKAFLLYQSGHAWETQDPRLIKQAALAALHSQKFSYAEAYFSTLMRSHHPFSANLFSYYGYSLECQQKWQEAEQVYLETIQRFSSHPNGYRALAWMFGVGLALTVTGEQGLSYAHVALKLLPDETSWEILSACEARVGNFERAAQILDQLLLTEKPLEKRSQLQEALRRLRKAHPLDTTLISRALVA